MKIYDSNIGGAAAGATQKSSETQQTGRTGGASSTTSAGSSSDRVEFSGTLSRLSRTLANFQSDRAGRVEQLADQYRNGAYRPDSAAISRGMISELLSSGGQAQL